MPTIKAKIYQPISSDAGTYEALKHLDLSSGILVEGTLTGKDDTTLLISGDEFIRIGGLEEGFSKKIDYMWGAFEQVEQGAFEVVE